ncbi:MAG: protein kinase [Thermoanaerobaculia bacterium]|nr:protein kinase [Thermoanaerobaculia bacterium]
MLPRTGSELGIYRLIVRLGAGGMGEVWKAEDTRLHRIVAIKLLPHSMTGDGESRARLLREARTAGQLSHPNIATIHGIELDGDTPYIVMEYVEGETLTRAIAARSLSESQVAEVGRAIADALADAHAKGIIHRDIKPDNVVLSGSRVKVLDFGIAKRFGEDAQIPAGEFVTEAGVVLGTVNYMSPEQATGKPLDGRSDIFALGVMLYQALSGQLPFRGNTNLETLKQILRSEPRDLCEIAPAVSREMAGIVWRCLRKKVEERTQDAGTLASELARVAARGATAAPKKLPLQPPSPPVASDAAGALAGVAATPGPKPVTAPRLALTNTQWAIAGAAFVIVLAIAGGFAAARLVGKPDEPAPSTASQAGSASGSLTDSDVPAPATAATTQPPPVAVPENRATPEPKTQGTPMPARALPATTGTVAATRATEAPPAEPEVPAPADVAPGDEYRVALAGLEASGWHYLDSAGRLTPAASRAAPLLQKMLRSEPGNDSARLYLAVTRLFGGKYDSASKELLPLIGPSSRLDETERVLAGFAYSAATTLASGSDPAALEGSLRANAAYLNSNAQLAAFAEDARRLLKGRTK